VTATFSELEPVATVSVAAAGFTAVTVPGIAAPLPASPPLGWPQFQRMPFGVYRQNHTGHLPGTDHVRFGECARRCAGEHRQANQKRDRATM
jgi:hypothetical protein